MAALHEIGFLLLTASPCALWTSQEAQCPAGKSFSLPAYMHPDSREKPARVLGRGEGEALEAEEAGYEERGIKTFEKRDEGWFRVRSKDGTFYWLHAPAKQWEFRKLEARFADGAMVSGAEGFASELREGDLKSVPSFASRLDQLVRQARLDRVLKKHQLSEPVAALRVRVRCTWKELGQGQRSGACEPVPSAPIYEQPSDGAAKVLPQASISLGHLRGLPDETVSLAEHAEELFLFEVRGDWLKVRTSNNKFAWLERKRVQAFSIKPYAKEGARAALIKLLESDAGLAEEVRALDAPADLESTGRTRWESGTLWVEVVVQDASLCAVDDPKRIGKGWLPYSLRGKPVLGWYPRGC